jgi:hypothetical protein
LGENIHVSLFFALLLTMMRPVYAVGVGGTVCLLCWKVLHCTVFLNIHANMCTVPAPAMVPSLFTGDPPKSVVTSFQEHSEFTQAQMADWQKLNPEYTIVGYSDAEAAAYLLAHFPPWATDLYSRVKFGPLRGDVFRSLYIFREGGTWVDIDVVLRTPFREWGVEGDAVWMPRSRSPFQINPTVIVAIPNDPTMRAVVDMYRSLSRGLLVGRSYWGLSIVHVVSELVFVHDFHVDASALEICPEKNVQRCFILGGNTEILFYNRHPEWDSVAHVPL